MSKAPQKRAKAAPLKAGVVKSARGPADAAAKKAAGKKLLAKKLNRLAPLLARLAGPEPDAAVLDRLHAVITERRSADPARSHSARLLSRGMPKVAQKFGEEAVECLIEAVSGNREALVAESADVLYHLLVLWVAAGVQPHQVWEELIRREGISGITEKAGRAGLATTTKIP